MIPAGNTVRITHDPFGMAMSPDGKKAVTLHDGVFTIIELNSLQSVRVPSYDGKIVSPFTKGSYLGVAFTPDSKSVYGSGGDIGAVIVYDLEKMKRTDSISLNGAFQGTVYDDSFTSDLLLNKDKNELLVLDRGNFRMLSIDGGTQKIIVSIKETSNQ